MVPKEVEIHGWCSPKGMGPLRLQREIGMTNVNNEPGQDLGVLRRGGCLRGLPLPVPEGLRRLPIGDPRSAFREPAMFGAVCFKREQGVLEVTFARHPTMLTVSEKLRMVKYERVCTTSRSDYRDQRQEGMVRRPLRSCGYGIVGTKNLSDNAGVHFRANLNELGCRCRIFFQAKGLEEELEHPRRLRQRSEEAEGLGATDGGGGECLTRRGMLVRRRTWCEITRSERRLGQPSIPSRRFAQPC